MSLQGAFRIFRLPNLLMVAATMYLMRWSIIKPLLAIYGIQLQISEPSFLGLVLSTILITAAGYVINDYHDVRADQVNKPGKLVIDLHISRRSALVLYLALNAVGVSAGIVFSLLYRVPWMIIVFAGAPFLVWYYSVRLKHVYLVGNLAVSLLTATVPMLVILFEYPQLARHFRTDEIFFPHGLSAILVWVGAFAFFAFMTNLIREIVKDAMDVEGDKELDSHTIPIRSGYRKANRIVAFLTILTIVILAFFFLAYLRDPFSLGYFAVVLLAPMVYLVIRVLRTADKADISFSANGLN
jgi:4-hydroxybenzoate polyprenyltransferase